MHHSFLLFLTLLGSFLRAQNVEEFVAREKELANAQGSPAQTWHHEHADASLSLDHSWKFESLCLAGLSKKAVTFDRYNLTAQDLEWAAKMIHAETNGDAGEALASAMLSVLAARVFLTDERQVQAVAQELSRELNPDWLSGGKSCSIFYPRGAPFRGDLDAFLEKILDKEGLEGEKRDEERRFLRSRWKKCEPERVGRRKANLSDLNWSTVSSDIRDYVLAWGTQGGSITDPFETQKLYGAVGWMTIDEWKNRAGKRKKLLAIDGRVFYAGGPSLAVAWDDFRVGRDGSCVYGKLPEKWVK